jgi:O-acetyl-ADP-ribose deacetylase (regulator of RNase III)
MILFIKGNLFDSKAEAWVNTVNTVGVMGKGIALQFKERFPENFKLYKKACEAGELKIGKMFVTKNGNDSIPKWIINFPTKIHWMQKSNYKYIETGLDDLIKVIKDLNIQSIALPPLGSGQGGLKWEKVKEILVNKLSQLDEVKIEIYEPDFIPEKILTQQKNSLTKQRGMILFTIQKYNENGFELTMLEIQKLAYFLQRLGQSDLKLNFKKYYYGPYAHNLQHLLHQLEGTFLITSRSFLDIRPFDVIYLNPDNLSLVEEFIEKNCSSIEKKRLEVITKLIDGFESPFGLELLSSIDWVLNHKDYTEDISEIKIELLKWNKRKKLLFTDDLIKVALQRLKGFKIELGYESPKLQSLFA